MNEDSWSAELAALKLVWYTRNIQSGQQQALSSLWKVRQWSRLLGQSR